MTPVIAVPIWRRGMAIPQDLPSGQYTIIYRIPGLLASPALVAAERMVGKRMTQTGGTEALKVTGYRCVSKPFSPNVDFHFYCECEGIAPVVAWAIVGAIAVACGLVAIFTYSTAVEIRRVLTSPAGQTYLKSAGGAAGTTLIIGGAVLILAVLAGLAIYAKQKAGA